MRQALRHVIGGAVCRAVDCRSRVGAGRRDRADQRNCTRYKRSRPAGRRRDRDADRHQLHAVHRDRRRRQLRPLQPADRTVPTAGDALRIPHVPAHRHRAAGQRQSRNRDRDGDRRARRDGVGRSGDAAGRDAQPCRRPGHRKRAHRGAAAQRTQPDGPDRAGRAAVPQPALNAIEPQHAGRHGDCRRRRSGRSAWPICSTAPRTTTRTTT